ncbi:MAG: sigma-70 family RNA polymerase sigma factor [Actinomycetota bacterium]
MTLDQAMPLVQAGDTAAFATVYDELARPVYGTILRVLRDPAMSEEVAQEVFLELWRTAERFDATRGSVSAWAITVARRRAVDRVRREQTRRDVAERHAGRALPHDAASVDDEVAGAIDATRIRAALDTLPTSQREVIELAFLDGYAHGTIADRLGLPLGTVKGRVRGGLTRLRAALGDAR